MSADSGRIGFTDKADELVEELLYSINESEDSSENTRLIKKDIYRLAVCAALQDFTSIKEEKLQTSKNYRLNEIDSDGSILTALELIIDGYDRSNINNDFERLANHGVTLLSEIFEKNNFLNLSQLFDDAR